MGGSRYMFLKHAGIRVCVFEAGWDQGMGFWNLWGLGYAFVKHGGLRYGFLKHEGIRGCVLAIRIQRNLKLDRLSKPLPERLIFIAREPFFGLGRISGFWIHQNPTKP